MPLPGDLVHQTSITAGTGAQTLVAVNGKRTFLQAFGTGGTNTFDYYISHRTTAEHERGTGHESGGTLVRDTVLANHLGTTALVNFSAGIKDITNDVPADQRVLKDFAQALTNKTFVTEAVADDSTKPATTAHVKDYAAPFNALAYNNIIVNGWFEHSQEYGMGWVPNWINFNGYFADQWRVANVIATPGSTDFTIGCVGSYVGLAYANAGGVQVVGASNSFAGVNDYFCLNQPIEGSRLQGLSFGTANATPVSLGFWVNATATGTFTVVLGWTKYYAHNFTVNVANTWEYKTFTFPGDPTGGSTDWPSGNVGGARLQFCFAAGSAQKVLTPDAWTSPWSKNATASQSNFFATVNNYVYLGGVTLLPGSIAPSQAQSVLTRRPMGEELALCTRYLQVIHAPVRWVPNGAGWPMGWPIYFQPMRTTPTVTISPSSRVNVASVTSPAVDVQTAAYTQTATSASVDTSSNDYLSLFARM
jgi:hypothetical protein